MEVIAILKEKKVLDHVCRELNVCSHCIWGQKDVGQMTFNFSFISLSSSQVLKIW